MDISDITGTRPNHNGIASLPVVWNADPAPVPETMQHVCLYMCLAASAKLKRIVMDVNMLDLGDHFQTVLINLKTMIQHYRQIYTWLIDN